MPRNRRQVSSTHVYHVIFRGINQQILFEEKADYHTFLTILQECRQQDHFRLFAYCLMDNHVHLLVEDTDVPLAVSMSRLEVRFARWYNFKYNRSGYVFQDRYKSCPVETERYLLTVFRYIHQNPYHAGIEKEVGTYQWSSFQDYFYEYDKNIDRDMICSLFSSKEELLCFIQTPVTEQHMEYFSQNRIPDKEALCLIREISGCSGPGEFQRLDLQTRNAFLQEILKFGISVRQISRLTGVTKASVEKIKRS